MRIAVVGSGVSGLIAADELRRRHDVVMFEAESRIGGHVHTVDVEAGGRSYSLDTGFLVFHPELYPGFVSVLDRLGVESRPTCMSFSVRCDEPELEYQGGSLDSLFCQRRNLVRPAFLRMVRDVVRFYRQGARQAASVPADLRLDEFLERFGYSREFARWHLGPLGSALWSSPPTSFDAFPVGFVLPFLERHELLDLDVSRRVRWRTVVGGSRTYVDRLTAPWRDRIRLSCPVREITRSPGGVTVATDGGRESFDHVVLACHGDQALRLLADADEPERDLLGAIRYQTNPVVLHTDESLLPRRRKAWASWNFHARTDRDAATVTYDLNRLQGIDAPTRFLVTLNETDAVDPSRILKRIDSRHPQYDAATESRRLRLAKLQGRRSTWFCGAYFGHGFHEDGVRAAFQVRDGLDPMAQRRAA